ncbi:hypothetical protein [Streptomyces deserti]
MQRKGGRRREGGERDVEAVLDELYVTPPSAFVSRREELAAEARKDGRADDARRIHSARRPTLAAWTANLLFRSRPEESRRFLELGQSLREAYRTLDASGLKELSARRRQVVSALSRQAAQLAGAAGHRPSGAVQEEVESTLRAVLADPEAAQRWATGRLESALTPPSEFPSGATSTAGTAKHPARAPARPPEKGQVAERRRQRQERLAQAREAAEAAARRLGEQRERQAEAEESLRRARDRREQARQQVAAAEEELRRAREELERADRHQRQAEEHHATAADALARLEREAREADREVERLSGSRAR